MAFSVQERRRHLFVVIGSCLVQLLNKHQRTLENPSTHTFDMSGSYGATGGARNLPVCNQEVRTLNQ